MVDASAPNARARRPAHGRRGGVPRPLPEDHLRGGDVGRVDAGRHPLRARAPAVLPAAVRRAAAPGARLLPEPPHLDQRGVRQESPLLRAGHPHRRAPRARQEQPAAAARSLRAHRPPPAARPRLRLGRRQLPAPRPAGGGGRGEGADGAAAHLLLRALHGRDARLRVRRAPRRPRGADHHRGPGGPRPGLPAAPAPGAHQPARRRAHRRRRRGDQRPAPAGRAGTAAPAPRRPLRPASGGRRAGPGGRRAPDASTTCRWTSG